MSKIKHRFYENLAGLLYVTCTVCSCAQFSPKQRAQNKPRNMGDGVLVRGDTQPADASRVAAASWLKVF